MANAITWFEIPSIDFDRAVTFYETVLAATIHKEVFMGVSNGIFVAADHEVKGAIIHSDLRPSRDGALIYLNAAGQLAEAVARVASAGGQVLLPVTDIGDPGSIAIILDSEGNRVGLHSPK